MSSSRDDSNGKDGRNDGEDSMVIAGNGDDEGDGSQ